MSQDLATRPITPLPPPATLPPVKWHFPFLSCAILTGLGVVFFAEHLFAVTPSQAFWGVGVPTLDAMGGLSRQAVLRGEWFRLFSATLLHADLMHLLFNGIALLLAGAMLEHIIGRAWFGTAYVIGGLTGALFSCFLNSPEVISVGASGAITGLFATLWLVSYLYSGTDRQKLQTNAMRVLAPAILPVFWAGSSNVDYWAHIGGALGGAGVGFFLLKNWPVKDWPHAVEPPLMPVATTISIAGLVLAVATAIPITQGHFARDYLIPPHQYPQSDADWKTQAEGLVAKYPGDPRGHIYLSFVYSEKRDFPATERALRLALAQKEGFRLLPPMWEPTAKALLKSMLYFYGAELQRQNRTDEALAKFNEVISMDVPKVENKDLQERLDRLRPYAQRGLLYLLKRQNVRALQDFDEEIRRHPQEHVVYFERGRAQFHTGNYKSAIADFRKSLEANPATEENYAYYALWLYMAQRGAHVPAAFDLSSFTNKVAEKKWPFPIANFYLGNISERDLRAAATNSNERCEVDFYLAGWHLVRGQKDSFAPLLRQARNGCPKNFIEYTAALIELQKLGE